MICLRVPDRDQVKNCSILKAVKIPLRCFSQGFPEHDDKCAAVEVAKPMRYFLNSVALCHQADGLHDLELLSPLGKGQAGIVAE